MSRIIAGQYEARDRLGGGNMGEVWSGRDLQLDRTVAIKVLKPELASDSVAFERFRTEAVALAKLQHPNIAGVYNFLNDGGQWCLIMELAEGQGLDAKLKELGQIQWRAAVAIVKQVLQALAQVHRLGLVHRDIKPSNLVIDDDGHVKLIDFGITRSKGQERLTRQGLWIGTLEYASPEQLKGAEADARSDLYAVACVLFELLTGRVPFSSTTDYELIKQHVEQPVPSLSALVSGVPQSLERVIETGMAKDPSARFQTADAFVEALDRSASGDSIVASKASPAKVVSPRPSPSVKSKPAPAGQARAVTAPRLVTGIAVVLGLAGILLMWLSRSPGAGGSDSMVARPSAGSAAQATASVARPASPSPEAMPSGQTTLATGNVVPAGSVAASPEDIVRPGSPAFSGAEAIEQVKPKRKSTQQSGPSAGWGVK